MMKARWRLVDTGSRSAADNMALDATLLEARRRGMIPNTLRFLRFSSPAVLVGYHQAVAQEVRVDFCRERGIAVNRRLTGGGAIYFDPGQIGWEIVARLEDLGCASLAALSRRIGEAAARGLRKLGIPAAFRPRNDIEVEGRKISGTGGVVDDGVFLFQGTVLTDFDVETMLKALRVPTEKLTPKGLDSARERVTCLRDLLDPMPSLETVQAALAEGFAEALGVTLQPGSLTPFEEAYYRAVRRAYRQDAWIHLVQAPPANRPLLRSVLKRPGGLIRVAAAVDLERSVLRQVLISGDFFIHPRRAVYDLEAALKDTPFSQVASRMEAFFAERPVEPVGLAPQDFVAAVRMALEKAAYPRMGVSLQEADALYPVNLPEGKGIQDVLREATVLLLPYCAKLPECKYRFKQGCDECGLCTVGEAYRLARARGLEAITIVRYEHLIRTLRALRRRGVRAYVGCCCEEFYVKRQQAFVEAALPGVLLGIEGRTCYELHQEKDAYAGTFRARADLKVGLLEKVVAQVPGKAARGPEE